jgi:hypothetical protein
MISSLQVAHFFCAAYMTGVIWFVQLVQYPMLHYVGDAEGKGHTEYTQRMGFVVMPVMLLELGLQGFWLWQSPRSLMAGGPAALLLLIWLSTFFLQIPCHQKLAQGHDPAVQRRLVAGNWIRTFAWTARALWLGWIVWLAN